MVLAFTHLHDESWIVKSARSVGFDCLCVIWVYVVNVWRPKGRVSLVCSGLSGRNGTSKNGSLDSAMESNVSGYSSPASGMDRTTSTVYRLGLAPLLLNVSFLGLEDRV